MEVLLMTAGEDNEHSTCVGKYRALIDLATERWGVEYGRWSGVTGIYIGGGFQLAFKVNVEENLQIKELTPGHLYWTLVKSNDTDSSS